MVIIKALKKYPKLRGMEDYTICDFVKQHNRNCTVPTRVFFGIGNAGVEYRFAMIRSLLREDHAPAWRTCPPCGDAGRTVKRKDPVVALISGFSKRANKMKSSPAGSCSSWLLIYGREVSEKEHITYSIWINPMGGGNVVRVKLTFSQ